MTHATKFFAGIGLALGLLAGVPPTSQASDELTAVQSDNYHYFVHAGNCSRSIRLVQACTCPDEAEYYAEQLREKNRLVWIKTTPQTY
jgi:hypothetical protein